MCELSQCSYICATTKRNQIHPHFPYCILHFFNISVKIRKTLKCFWRLIPLQTENIKMLILTLLFLATWPSPVCVLFQVRLSAGVSKPNPLTLLLKASLRKQPGFYCYSSLDKNKQRPLCANSQLQNWRKMEHGIKAFRHLDEYTFNWSDFFFPLFSLFTNSLSFSWNLQQTTLRIRKGKEKLSVPLWFQCSFSFIDQQTSKGSINIYFTSTILKEIIKQHSG